MNLAGTVLVFGATGAIGSACVQHLRTSGAQVFGATRGPAGPDSVSTSDPGWLSAIAAAAGGRLDGVVWAQGANASGSILTTGPGELAALFAANVAFVVDTARQLLDARLVSAGSRLVVVSSIWQEQARSDKLAYTVSKSAVAGLVRSLAVDLGSLGIAINAVLPGVLDTPMTRANLTAAQIKDVAESTPLGVLATTQDVARAVGWLVSPLCAGVTGQFVTVDGGYSVARRV